MKDLTPIFEAIITLLAAIITVYVIPYIKKKFSAEDLNTILEWVRIAVEAAEQIITESGMGEKKKALVKEFLAEKNIVVDVDKMDMLIEAAVHNMNKELKKETK